MPAQTVTGGPHYYGVGDRAPDLVDIIRDGNGDPMDLTGKTIAITIAHAKYDHYYSPGRVIVEAGPCVPDPDQNANKGVVRWTPAAGDLSPAGSFHYQYKLNGIQTIPPHTYGQIVIRVAPGGPSVWEDPGGQVD